MLRSSVFAALDASGGVGRARFRPAGAGRDTGMPQRRNDRLHHRIGYRIELHLPAGFRAASGSIAPTINRAGVDIGATAITSLAWGVFAPTVQIGLGDLSGNYGGVAAGAHGRCRARRQCTLWRLQQFVRTCSRSASKARSDSTCLPASPAWRCASANNHRRRTIRPLP